jgi:hypothetical protein
MKYFQAGLNRQPEAEAIRLQDVRTCGPDSGMKYLPKVSHGRLPSCSRVIYRPVGKTLILS